MKFSRASVRYVTVERIGTGKRQNPSPQVGQNLEGVGGFFEVRTDRIWGAK